MAPSCPAGRIHTFPMSNPSGGKVSPSPALIGSVDVIDSFLPLCYGIIRNHCLCQCTVIEM